MVDEVVECALRELLVLFGEHFALEACYAGLLSPGSLAVSAGEDGEGPVRAQTAIASG